MNEEKNVPSRAQALLEALDQLSRHINRQIYRQNHRRATLRHGQGRVLRLLSEQDGMTQSALAEAAQLRPPTVAELLDKLESAGMVARTRDPNDRRRSLVSVTDMGRESLDDLRDGHEQFAADLFSGLTDDEVASMLAIVEKLNTQFRNEEDFDAPPMPPFGGDGPHGPFGHGPRPGCGPECGPDDFDGPRGPFGHGPRLGCGPRPPYPPRKRPGGDGPVRD